MFASPVVLTACVALAGGAGGRPVLTAEEVIDTADGRFRLHFTRTGADAVGDADADADGVPDVLAWTQDGLTRVWDAFVTGDGWPGPGPDAGRGGDDRVDVYLHAIDSNGYAHSEDGGATCWMELDPSVGAAFGATVFSSVAGHELHHCLQFGVATGLDSWIYEATSTYAQYLLFTGDQAIELARDTLWQIRLIGSERALHDETGQFEYAAMIWPKYLLDRAGADRTALLALWQAMGTAGDWQAGHEQALPGLFGLASLDVAAAEHATWNLFACDADDGLHWADDPVRCEGSSGVGGTEVTALPADGVGDMVGRLGSDYVAFEPDCATADLRVEVTPSGHARIQLVEIGAGEASPVTSVDAAAGQPVVLTAADWNWRHRVMLVSTALDDGAAITWSASASGEARPPPSPPPLRTLTIDPAGPLVLAEGDRADLRALGGYDTCLDGRDLSAEVTWTVSDVGVAEVIDGELVAVGAGESALVASIDDITSDSIDVVVEAPTGCGCQSSGDRPTWALLLVVVVVLLPLRSRASVRGRTIGTRGGRLDPG